MALIGLRLIAIYLIAQGITSMPNIYLLLSTYSQESSGTNIVYVSIILAILSPLLIGILLWVISPKICNYLIPENKDTSSVNRNIDIKELQITAIVLIGVYLSATTIPYAFSVNYQLFSNMVEVNGAKTCNLSILYNAISVNVKLLVAVLLIIGSTTINNIIVKIRTSGTN